MLASSGPRPSSPEIGPGATVGPFSYLRPGTRLGAKGKIGGFVGDEERRHRRGRQGAAPDLLRRRDDQRGRRWAPAPIFANYDGVTKGRTNVGAHSFVGSNSVIVAPRTIADGAYVAAGSAVVSDVTPGQLAVTRAQQRNVDGWVAQHRAGTKTDEAARAAQGQATPAQTPGGPSEQTSEQTPAQTSETKDAQR